MTKTPWTPGKWEYRPTKYHDWGTVVVGDFCICQARAPETTFDDDALAKHRSAGTDPWEANARLIAAAPEMADALVGATASLVAAISLLERGGRKAAASDKMFEQMLVDYRGSVDRARAVLAKARGEGQ